MRTLAGWVERLSTDGRRLKPREVVAEFDHYLHDELDLPPGALRLKFGGGLGGHNGLKDIAAHLGTQDFWRLRIGVGHPGDRNQVVALMGRLTADNSILAIYGPTTGTTAPPAASAARMTMASSTLVSTVFAPRLSNGWVAWSS